MTKPSYPRDILPQPKWIQSIIVGDILKSCPNAMLGHLLVGDYKQCIDDSAGKGMEFIRRDALPLERMVNLSCSLLGTYFMLHFFHFLPCNEGKKPWHSGMDISEELLSEENYNFYPEITVVGWPLHKVEGFSLPYPRKFAKQKEFENYQDEAVAVARERERDIIQHEWAELVADEENKKLRIAEFDGETRNNHAPTLLNYWHFTIDLYSANDNQNPLKKVSKGWGEKMATNLQDFLCNTFAFFTETSLIPRIEDEGIWVK